MIRLKPPQWSLFNCDSRFRVLVAGRRFGKTYLSMVELCRSAWGTGRLAWYVAPSYKQAKRIVWQPLKQMTRPYWAARPNETDLRIELLSGGTICLRGADNYDSLRGNGLDFLILDEYASIAPEAWTEVLRPALADKQGHALFIGTPRGYDHFFDLYQKVQGQPDWDTFQFTTEQGGNVSTEELESAARELDERTYRQEFQASFENMTGGPVYYAFDRKRNVKDVEFDPLSPISWSLDFNINPMCSVIAQVIDTTNRMEMLSGIRSAVVHVLDELFIPNCSTPQACEEFYNRTERYRRGRTLIVNVYGDATGSKRQTANAGAESDWQTIREFFARHSAEFRVSFKYKHCNPAVRDRVAAVNGVLQNALGQSKLFIDPRCKYLIKDLERVVWKPGSSVLDQGSDPQLTHISDALGYLCEAEFGIRPPGGYDPRYIA